MRIASLEKLLNRLEEAAAEQDYASDEYFLSLGYEQDERGAWYNPHHWLSGDLSAQLPQAAREAVDGDDWESFGRIRDEMAAHGRARFLVSTRQRIGEADRGSTPACPQ